MFLYESNFKFQLIIITTIKDFSSLRVENTFFPRDAIEKNAFSPHWERKIAFYPWEQEKNVPGRSLQSSASPWMVVYVRSGPFFSFAPLVKNVQFFVSGQKARISRPRHNVKNVFSSHWRRKIMFCLQP